MGRRKVVRAEYDEDDKVRPPLLALTIREFCEAHRISEGMFYKLKKQGLTPTEMRLGTRSVISLEAAAAWRAEREAGVKRTPAPAKAPAKAKTARAVA